MKKPPPERYLISPISLAVARVEGNGDELSAEMQAWADRYNAFLVAPVGEALTDDDRKAAQAEAANAAQQEWVREAIETARQEGYAAGQARAVLRTKAPAAPKQPAPAQREKHDAALTALKAEVKQLKASTVRLDLEAAVAERDNLKLKIEVLQDVVSQCGSEEDGETWDVAKLQELAEIVREIL